MPRGNRSVGIVFDIIKYAIHDGPGIRTTVFLKGCPLTCLWCQNPESQKKEPEIVNDVQGRKYSSIFFAKDKNTIGHEVTVEQVMSEVKKDAIFYEHSGGGVTFSGGEPLMQPDFLLCLLRECKKQGIHTVVDTSGQAPWSTFKHIIRYTDLFLYDLKLMDDSEHKKHTGVGTELILKNLQKLAMGGAPIVIRFPLIPGITDKPDNVRAIGSFLRDLKHVDTLHILPYNYLCKDKYRRMGKKYSLKDLAPPSNNALRAIGKRFKDYGLQIRIRGME
ncbi:MAG: glycyl-radical enzyme activating protein [candidate division WOR-3 bacterium]|nr:glycyl-radical enzyme activating protein [candidate division WOR-3 bacterium]